MKKINILTQPLEKLTDADLVILKKINEHPELVITYNIKKMAAFCYTSVATISRFIRKFGFSSYKDFIIHVNHIHQLSKLTFARDQDKANIFSDLVASGKYAIENIISPYDYQKLQKIAHLISQSTKIALFGIGSSFNACQELFANLWKINKPCFASADFHIFLATLANWKNKDLIILFSNRANNRELIYVINYCHLNKISTVLITSNSQFHHLEKVKQSIIHANAIQPYRVSALSSKISQNLIADLLFRMIVFANPRYQAYFTNVKKNLERWNKHI